MPAEPGPSADPVLILDPDDLDIVRSHCDRHREQWIVLLFSDGGPHAPMPPEKDASREFQELLDQKLCADHRRTVRDVIGWTEAGRLVAEVGGSALCCFPDPASAVQHAYWLQRDIERLNRGRADYEKLCVRIGIDGTSRAAGESSFSELVGRVAHRAGRIVDLTPPGQIRVSERVYLAVGNLLEGAMFRWEPDNEARPEGGPASTLPEPLWEMVVDPLRPADADAPGATEASGAGTTPRGPMRTLTEAARRFLSPSGGTRRPAG